jgi:hypothetical protein
MRPTAVELIAYLDEAYTERILPELSDPFVRNRANILSQIIGALYQRWTLEGPMHVADLRDLRDLLERARSITPGVDIDGALAAEAAARRLDGEYVAPDELSRRVQLLREALVAVIDTVAQDTTPERKAFRSEIRVYLRRQLDRELEMCAAPVFGEGEGVGRRPDLPRA